MKHKLRWLWRGTKSALARNVLYYNPVLNWALGICTIVAAATTLQNGWIISQVFAMTMIPVNVLSSLLYWRIPRYIRAAVVPITAAVFYTIAIMVLRQQYGDWTTLFRYYLPLMAVNSLVLSRGVRYAPRQSLMVAVLDAVSCSIGFGAAACGVGVIRELLVSGTLLGIRTHMAAVPFFGFVALGFLAAAARGLRLKHDKKAEAAQKYAEKRRKGGAE